MVQEGNDATEEQANQNTLNSEAAKYRLDSTGILVKE
jgi:hypothetical protein